MVKTYLCTDEVTACIYSFINHGPQHWHLLPSSLMTSSLGGPQESTGVHLDNGNALGLCGIATETR